MKKRLFATFLSLCMVISLLPVTAMAEEGGGSETTSTTTTETLQGKIDTAESNATIRLDKNYTESITIGENQTITLDLNGYKLVNSANTQDKNNTETKNHTITNKGTLTITDTSDAKTGTVDNVSHGKAALYNAVGGTVTLNGGTYTRSAEKGTSSTENGDNSFYTLQNQGTMTINDGVTVNQGADGNGKYSSLVANGWQNGNQNTQKVESVMTINGGTFSGGLNTIKNDDYGKLTITGGTIQNVAQAAILNWNVAAIEGGTFSIDDGAQAVILNASIDDTMDKGELTITGGEFKAASGSQALATMNNTSAKNIGTITISGGKLDGDIKLLNITNMNESGTLTISDSAVITGDITNNGKDTVIIENGATVEGTVSNSVNGTVTVQGSTIGAVAEGSSVTVVNSTVGEETNVTQVPNGIVALVSGKTYTSLSDAISAAQAGDTVTLLDDITVESGSAASTSAAIIINKAITLDGNGKSITAASGFGNTSIINVEDSGEVTIKNLTVNGTPNSASGTNSRHGINIYSAADTTSKSVVTLENVVTTGGLSGVTIGGSDVTIKGDATNIANGTWYAINLDSTSSSTNDASLTVEEGTIGNIWIENTSGTKDVKAEIKDGNIENVGIKKEADSNKTSAEISGGTFSNSVAKYVVSTLNYEANNNGTYTYHTTLADALATGGTVKSIAAVNAGEETATYTVTLDNNGVKTEITVTEKEQITLPSAGTRPGYRFLGWFVNGKTYQAGQKVEITDNTTIIAQWHKNTSPAPATLCPPPPPPTAR